MRTCILLSLLASGAALTYDLSDRQIGPDPEFEDANHAVTNGKPVFYQIVMGSFPMRRQYKLWMASLRQVGKYDGTVVFVTDKPGCISQGLGEKLLGGKMMYSDKNVDIYPGTGAGQVHILKVKKPQSIRGIKMHKSKAWANLAMAKVEHPVSSIIYTDTDVVIGKDLNSFLAYEKSLEKKKFTLALFPDIGDANWEGGTDGMGPSGKAVHTGVVVMFPNKHSQACLKQWGEQVGGGSDDPKPIHHFSSSMLEAEVESEEGSAGIDQQALHHAPACQNSGDGMKKMSTSYLNLPNEKSMEVGKTAQFVHITNTERWHAIKTSTKARFFKEKLQISDDIDWEKTGACARDVWATPEYIERNGIKSVNGNFKVEAIGE